jgi:hypothetical protein
LQLFTLQVLNARSDHQLGAAKRRYHFKRLIAVTLVQMAHMDQASDPLTYLCNRKELLALLTAAHQAPSPPAVAETARTQAESKSEALASPTPVEIEGVVPRKFVAELHSRWTEANNLDEAAELAKGGAPQFVGGLKTQAAKNRSSAVKTFFENVGMPIDK